MLRKSARLLVRSSSAVLNKRATPTTVVAWSARSDNIVLANRFYGDESNRGGGEGRREEDSGRRLRREVLYGFSVLSLAGVWGSSSSNSEEEEKEPENKEDVQNGAISSFRLPRFGVSAAEPIGGGGGVGGGGDGDESKLTRRQRYNFIAEVVKETSAALVYIEIKDTAHRDFFTGQPVTVSNGSGFIVKEDGLILTNAHVVINKPRASIQVRLQSGEVYAATVEDVDVRSDLATLRIQCKNLPVMRLGSSKDCQPGEFVVAMGSPLALSNTITTGIVSNVARPPTELGLQGAEVPEYIQTDAAITFGNSGGPLINLDGEAIGINSMKVTPGISFAIPIDYAKEFLTKSEEAGKAGGHKTGKRRYIGITMVSLSPQMIDELKVRTNIPSNVTHGILIYRLVVGSPADRAGIRPGDIVTHINGKPVHGSRDVYKILEGTETPLVLSVSRDKGVFVKVAVHPE